MITRTVLSEKQARDAIATGEFDEGIRKSSRFVAVVLTQDWCPQWSTLKNTLNAMEKGGEPAEFDIDVYELVYNLSSYSGEFMEFKERVFGNYEIPYVRYYIDGELTGESNWVSKKGFLNYFRED